MNIKIKDLLFVAVVCMALFLPMITLINYYYYSYLVDRIEAGDNKQAINEVTGDRVAGVWFPEGAYCISADEYNTEELKDTVCHEVLHKIISEDHGCGGVSCKEHFCKN